MNDLHMHLSIKGPRLIDGDNAVTVTDLILKKGTITVLIGPNGAGKTRLLEAAAGLRYIPGWHVSIGDESMWIRGRKRNAAALRAYSYGAQEPEQQLFSQTAEEELRYVLKAYGLPAAEQERRIASALSAIGWERSSIERSPFQMSGGERRRLALACVFAAPSDWVLLDEPTAGLDAEGHEMLTAKLKKCAEDGQGVLLVSHETDWAFELADTILLMDHDGNVRCSVKDELLAHPEWLSRIGMPIPDWLTVAHHMWKCGVPSSEVWRPERLAAAIVRLDGRDCNETVIKIDQNEHLKIDLAQVEPLTMDHMWKQRGSSESWFSRFDPRSVWIAYIFLSAGIFMQHSWSGAAWSLLLTITAIALCGVSLRRWRRPIAALSFFYVMLAALAGFNAGEGRELWSTEMFLSSMQFLLRPWLVMLIGFCLPMVITPLRLRRSLNKIVSFRGNVPGWWQKISLTIALLLRFVPMLVLEWERFSTISIARGKIANRSWSGAAQRLLHNAVPFLLALFRMGEHVSNALESRGVGSQLQAATAVTRSWRWRDSALAAGGGIMFLFLYWWAK